MMHTGFSNLLRFVLATALLFVLVSLAPASASALAPAPAAAGSEDDSALATLTGSDAVAATAWGQPSAELSANVVYVVRPGDTLARIAARYGVTVRAILAANPGIVNPNQIYIGQRIVIPRASTTPGGTTFTHVNIYLIGMDTGNVGCGDQVVAVRRNISATPAPLTAALNQLLSLHSQYYGESGLYNALYQSNLAVQRITSKGTAWNIYLTGTLRLGGVCDIPRVEAQLQRTALQFSTVKQVNYFINGVPLKTALSQK
jgi:LysM repeat protein